MNNDKIYEEKICRYCENYNTCEKTSYKIVEVYSSKRYLCGDYKYKK